MKKTTTKPRPGGGTDALHRALHARRGKVMDAINEILATHGVEGRVMEFRVVPSAARDAAPNPCPNGGTPTVVCRVVDGRRVCSLECV